MTSSTNQQTLRRLYRLCYAVGSVLTLCMVALLGWIAVCIALEKEPLASIAFLPDMPTYGVFILIAVTAAVTIAVWQYGASFHQRYEESVRKEGPLDQKHEKE